nr:MAG TPA: hypothetical protein [Caudoviricetes sp.]
MAMALKKLTKLTGFIWWCHGSSSQTPDNQP